MGITVGVLADLARNDPAAIGQLRKELAVTNAVLSENGLPEHQEPSSCDTWSADGYGYSGLHGLRAVAGLVWQGKDVPRDRVLDGPGEGLDQALFAEILAHIYPARPSLLQRLLRRGATQEQPTPPFAHLVAHSDAQGIYVPISFELPLVPAQMDDAFGCLWPLGSVPALQAELTQLAKLLDVPDDLLSTDDAMAELLEQGGRPDGVLWQAQPIATYSLLILREACAHSMKTGAAICFG